MKNINAVLCRLVLAAVIAVNLLAFVSPVSAYPRAGGGTAQTTTKDDGNTQTPFSAVIGTTTAVRVYAKTSGRIDRVLHICNPADYASTYVLLLSTSSGVNGVSTTDIRAISLVNPGRCETYTAPVQDWYAVYRATASGSLATFPTLRPVGYKQYDSRD